MKLLKKPALLDNLNILFFLLFLSAFALLLKLLGVAPFKIVVVLFLVLIVSALGSALYHLMSQKGDSTRLLKSLTWRIGLSVFLFALLMFGARMGWIQPHGLLDTGKLPLSKPYATDTHKNTK